MLVTPHPLTCFVNELWLLGHFACCFLTLEDFVSDKMKTEERDAVGIGIAQRAIKNLSINLINLIA